MGEYPNLMSIVRSVSLAAAALGSSNAQAQKSWTTIPMEMRTSTQPLEMVVHVAQSGLLAGRDPADADEGQVGVLAGIIQGTIQSSLQSGAQKGITSTQDVFTAKGADEALGAGIRKSLSLTSWIKVPEGPPLRDNSIAAKNALLDQVKGPNLVDVDCSYSVSQRFQAVYAYCLVQIASNAVTNGKPADRWKPSHLLYSRPVEAEIELANPAKSVGGRREQWTANSGALLRTGLELALQNVGMLVGRQLLLNQADLDAAQTRPQERIFDAYIGTTYGHQGHVIDGYDNIFDRISPNPAGRLLIFKPGAGGVVLLEKYNNLFYTYSLNAPVAAVPAVGH